MHPEFCETVPAGVDVQQPHHDIVKRRVREKAIEGRDRTLRTPSLAIPNELEGQGRAHLQDILVITGCTPVQLGDIGREFSDRLIEGGYRPVPTSY